MPRRISRVPPRSVKDGACRIVCASTARKVCVELAIGLRCDQHARDFRYFLLERGADILDERRLHRRILPRL